MITIMATPEPKLVEIRNQPAVAVHGEMPTAELPDFFGKAVSAAAAALTEAGAECSGPPFGYYPVKPTDTMVVIEAGFPVAEAVGLTGEVHDLVLPAGRVVVACHVGPYETMEKSYAALEAWMADSGLTPATGVWESYLSDPAVEPDSSKWRTKIVWPVTKD